MNIKVYYKQYANKLDNLDEIDGFLEKSHSTKTQESRRHNKAEQTHNK